MPKVFRNRVAQFGALVALSIVVLVAIRTIATSISRSQATWFGEKKSRRYHGYRERN
jgi:hypothetical protein